MTKPNGERIMNNDELKIQPGNQVIIGGASSTLEEMRNVITPDIDDGWGKIPTTETNSGSSYTSGKEIKYYDEFKIEEIISIRNKLEVFLDGSNILLEILNPQTIRETVRELRHEIRKIKRDYGISELAIVEYLEKEINHEADIQAQAKRDFENDVPF